MRDAARRNYTLLVATLLLGLGSLGAAYAFLSIVALDNRPAPVPRTLAVVAAVDIPAGAVISAEMLSIRVLAVESVRSPGVASVEELIGKVTVEPIVAGEEVLPSLVRPAAPTPEVGVTRLADLIPPGRRGVVIAFAEAHSEGALIQPGDLVDVVAVFAKETTGLDSDESIRILANVPVLAVARDAMAQQDGEQPWEAPAVATAAVAVGGMPGTPATPGFRQPQVKRASSRKTATLAVTLQEAQLLTLAQQNGQLHLVLRSSSDDRVGNPVDAQPGADGRR